MYYAWCPANDETQDSASPYGALDAKRAAQLHMRNVCTALNRRNGRDGFDWPVRIQVIDPDGKHHKFFVEKELNVEYVAHEVT